MSLDPNELIAKSPVLTASSLVRLLPTLFPSQEPLYEALNRRNPLLQVPIPRHGLRELLRNGSNANTRVCELAYDLIAEHWLRIILGLLVPHVVTDCLIEELARRSKPLYDLARARTMLTPVLSSWNFGPQ